MTRAFIAARTALLVVAITSTGLTIKPVEAGIPVIDGGNLVQNIMTVVEEIAQTIKQIQEYKTQLEQYQNMLQNTMAPAFYIWDQAQSIIGKIMNASNSLAYYRTRYGSLTAYLNKYRNVGYYRSSPCFKLTGCSDSEWAKLLAQDEFTSESQKQANDAVMKGLEQQQDTLKEDARRLERLQRAAQGADGQLAAIQYANQLASAQTTQLMQIRALMIAEQNAVTTRMQALEDKEAREAAAAAQFRLGEYKRSPKVLW